ncbi:MAG: hypothetical protein A2751_03540 [Candidatus Doudnabacteria bacterium RIFCSPHIGHO2_01_FULL_46_14]|uniref:Type II secretion system protein GspG C-terminal domain-containing protein n=1 Tax=Candidatus Doudnabacteria bacterium RIFCSPHIGHO2_01_FULL_46_14 TaxID=1817824 RepID=A0A1F5NKX6_9BACT|nr:MAG: hypothetical protein A2751_03540 [Candidatus Doudnabacteria bacterium RIFCSPHIGHO2_01_FULL_46_14]
MDNKKNLQANSGFIPTPQRRLVWGFTLIELLVVISVIGLLASVVIISLNSSRIKTRDTVRKQTLKQLQKALELYFDANGNYPIVSPYYSSEPGDVWPNGSGGNGDWIPGLSPNYVSKLPRDPLGGASTNPVCTPGGYKRAYYYRSLDGKEYKLYSHCGPEGSVNSDDPFYDPSRPTWAWMVCSGEPACSTW